jgi:hypothetical protein
MRWTMIPRGKIRRRKGKIPKNVEYLAKMRRGFAVS